MHPSNLCEVLSRLCHQILGPYVKWFSREIANKQTHTHTDPKDGTDFIPLTADVEGYETYFPGGYHIIVTYAWQMNSECYMYTRCLTGCKSANEMNSRNAIKGLNPFSFTLEPSSVK